MSGPVRFRVVPHEDGLTLIQLLGQRLRGASLEECRRLVKIGAVHIGRLRVRIPTTRVTVGERITAYPSALETDDLDPSILRFVHRDPAFVVLDKPAGTPVAATRSNAHATLSERLRRQLEEEGVKRPYVGVVHRLDQGASGLVLFTTRSAVNASLQRRFAEHRIERIYRVLVHGDPPTTQHCSAPIVALPGGRGVRIASEGEHRAQTAHTEFRRLVPRHARPGTALLEATLTTGRTHQIRIHLVHLGYPVVGDRRYGLGETEANEPCLHLHAASLAFTHPLEGTPLRFESDLPEWALSDEVEPTGVQGPDATEGSTAST